MEGADMMVQSAITMQRTIEKHETIHCPWEQRVDRNVQYAIETIAHEAAIVLMS